MALTDFALNKFVAQYFSSVSGCASETVGSDFPELPNWISNLVRSTMYRDHILTEKRAAVYTAVRRAKTAISDYDDAITELKSFRPDEKHIQKYFWCLRRLESSIAATCQWYNLIREVNGRQNFFNKGDDSVHDRLNDIYNHGRHTNLEELPTGHLHPVWISNNGLNAVMLGKGKIPREVQLLFSELRELLQEIGAVTQEMTTGRIAEN